uniref:G-protein coupled receptors family 1 profile domain-containing protein n=1 Tax=Ornithorhynchus anatinus TaxID=9258 RepID=A0A6I8PHK1_ORNAN
MCYDCYAVICQPLRYAIAMNRQSCLQMAAASWFTGTLTRILHVYSTFSLPYCGSNMVHQFFCEIPQILKLSCSGEILGELKVIVFISCLIFISFLFIIYFYAHIFSVVLKIASAEG